MIPIEWLHGLFERHPRLDPQAEAYRVTFATPAARQYVLPDLIEYAGLLAPLPTDPVQAQRMAGRIDMVLHIGAYLDLSADDIYTLRCGEGDTLRRLTIEGDTRRRA